MTPRIDRGVPSLLRGRLSNLKVCKFVHTDFSVRELGLRELGLRERGLSLGQGYFWGRGAGRGAVEVQLGCRSDLT